MIDYNLKASSTNDPRTSLKLAKEHLAKLKSKIAFAEKAIRAGGYSNYFDLIDAPVTMYVPKADWVNALGMDWVKEHEKPQEKQMVIVPKK